MHLERFDFRSKEQGAPLMGPVKRLDAQTIASHVHLAASQIYDDDCKHAIEPFKHSEQSKMLVEAKNHLGVGTAAEFVACGLQLGGVGEGIINFTVKRE